MKSKEEVDVDVCESGTVLITSAGARWRVDYECALTDSSEV